jgi:hypothetical protein
MPQSLQVVIIKPSKYMTDGFVERFRRGFMPTAIASYFSTKLQRIVSRLSVERHAR